MHIYFFVIKLIDHDFSKGEATYIQYLLLITMTLVGGGNLYTVFTIKLITMTLVGGGNLYTVLLLIIMLDVHGFGI